MTKKHGKDTFRHTKKNILHKKGVNSKKRGLRGGGKTIITKGVLRGFRQRYSLRSLNENTCANWLTDIRQYEKNNMFRVIIDPNSQGYTDYYGCLTMLELLVTFDTTLKTNSLTPQTLTLKKCKVIKIPEHEEYQIVSPAKSTAPTNGGEKQETRVGTFSQIPISIPVNLLRQSMVPPKLNIVSFSDSAFNTHNEIGTKYIKDYVECLGRVQNQFGINVHPSDGEQLTTFTQDAGPVSLPTFGKSKDCEIVLLASNIGTEIQVPTNNDSVFVIPSLFNGTGYLNSLPMIDLDTYKTDPIVKTQLSCHPAVAQFVMNYAAKSNFSSKFLVIDALGDVIENMNQMHPINPDRLRLINGCLHVSANDTYKLKVTRGETEYLNISDVFDIFCKNLKILQSVGVPTNGLKFPECTEFNSESESKVALIYASAVPLGYGEINTEKTEFQYCVAGCNLVAQYFGAMVSAYNKKNNKKKAAAKAAAAAAAEAKTAKTHAEAVEVAVEAAEVERRKAVAEEAAKAADEAETEAARMRGANMGPVKLFLTPLGGGEFNNPREMIAYSALLAYYQITKIFTDFNDDVEVIFLVCNDNQSEVNDFSEFFNTKEDLEAAAVQRYLDSNHPSKVPPNKLQPDGGDEEEDSTQAISLPSRLISRVAQVAHEPVAPEGGSKSRRRRRHHRKPARKTRRGRNRKSKPKSKTHRRRRVHKNKKYTRNH
jgi:hypothetical protein